MMVKKMLFTFIFILFAQVVHGQTTNVVQWDYDAALADVATYTHTVTVNGSVITSAPACVVVTSLKTSCSLTIPALNATSNTIIISAQKGIAIAETRITGFTATSIPAQQSGHKIKITISVNAQ
jgi:hypothetical protein